MEEEIDLRAYIEVLLRYWMWIVGLAVAAGVVAFVVTSLTPRTYEASAVVFVTQPRYRMQFDARLEAAENPITAYKAFPTLATSDTVLQGVVDSYTPSSAAQIDRWSLEALSAMAEAASEGDPSLVMLKITSRSPQDAAAIANLWADILSQRGNEIYGESGEDVAIFQAQMAEAKQAVDEADNALIEFEATDQLGTVNARLDSLRQAQAEYLTAQRNATYTIQDIRGLRAQLAEQPSTQPISVADSLTALLIQIKAFNAQSVTPIELQIDSTDPLTDRSLSEQIAFLDNLEATLRTTSSEIDKRLSDLEPQILDLQQQLQELASERAQLSDARELTVETYKTLARRVDEARISAQAGNSVLTVGSYAAVPETPAGPHKMLNTAVGMALGLATGLAVALFLGLLRGSQPVSKHERLDNGS
jgi:uncharacterized protein involved in exopolysaccharide biosynthesis